MVQSGVGGASATEGTTVTTSSAKTSASESELGELGEDVGVGEGAEDGSAPGDDLRAAGTRAPPTGVAGDAR